VIPQARRWSEGIKEHSGELEKQKPKKEKKGKWRSYPKGGLASPKREGPPYIHTKIAKAGKGGKGENVTHPEAD